MAHNHNDTHGVQHLYEGDQSKLYSGVMNHHFGHEVSGQESKKQVKRIWGVFWLLLVITIAEVSCGLMAYYTLKDLSKGLLAFIFLALTLVKARYIVSVFMHLGDERRNFLITVLIPLVLFIWFIIAFLADGGFWLHMNSTAPVR